MSIKNIITVTLNPALDVTAKAESLSCEREINYVLSEEINAGGKGINVSKDLAVWGVKSTAIIAVGEQNEGVLVSRITDPSITVKTVRVRGRVRENLTYLLPNGAAVRVDRRGSAQLTEADIDEVFCEIAKSVVRPCDTLVVFAGSLPEAMSSEKYTELVLRIKRTGVKIALDTSAINRTQLAKIQPCIYKPNLPELEKLFGVTIPENKVPAYAYSLVSSGVENAVISLGEKGLVYGFGGGCIKIKGVDVDAKYTVGAGDAALAGFIAGMAAGKAGKTLAKMSSAFGTAAVLNTGTVPPLMDDIVRIYKTSDAGEFFTWDTIDKQALGI